MPPSGLWENAPLDGDVEILINGQPRTIAGEASVASLLDDLGMAARHVAVEVNGELVPRGSHAERLLRPGDRLEIVTLVGGG